MKRIKSKQNVIYPKETLKRLVPTEFDLQYCKHFPRKDILYSN